MNGKDEDLDYIRTLDRKLCLTIMTYPFDAYFSYQNDMWNG